MLQSGLYPVAAIGGNLVPTRLLQAQVFATVATIGFPRRGENRPSDPGLPEGE